MKAWCLGGKVELGWIVIGNDLESGTEHLWVQQCTCSVCVCICAAKHWDGCLLSCLSWESLTDSFDRILQHHGAVMDVLLSSYQPPICWLWLYRQWNGIKYEMLCTWIWQGNMTQAFLNVMKNVHGATTPIMSTRKPKWTLDKASNCLTAPTWWIL